jgi:hypothetical protein
MVQGDTPELSYGVPDEFMTYADDNTPGSYVLKHPAGHSMSLIEKNTEQRSVNEIKLKSAGNKKLRISDAPADSGGDCLQLIDERDNQVKISSSKDTIDVIAADSINLTTNKGSIEHTVGAGAGNFNVDVLGSGDERHVVHNGNFYLSCAKDFSVLAQQNARLAAGGVAYVTAPVQAVMDSDTLVQVQSKGVTNVIGKVAANYVSEGPCVVGGSTTTLTGGLLWSPLPPPIPFIEDLIDPPPTAGDRASGGTYDPANDHPGVVGDEPAPGVGHITLHYGQPPELPLEERFKDKHVRVDSSSISLQLFGTDPVTGDAFIKQALKMTDSKTQIQTINGFNGNRASQSKITVSPSEIKFFVGDTNKVTAWCEVTIDRMGMNIDGS